ncbi:protein tweety homolog 1-A-like isoform X2 [Mya arenaria]|uniref:protein tweety homolog 1-A-like isoform X2 n=1 Tax=Mya arenaria TaxID=6604 RepID=UPI0022E41B7E|nr:protein tweety homolog 1-A-like isoform X2 [Mya arenaria]
MSVQSVYKIDWVASFLHKFPHINFKFEHVNSTFNTENSYYKESIIFLAALPIVWCVVVFLCLFGCLCLYCCCRERPTRKHKTTCSRCFVGLFIILAIGSVAVGFFGNEEGNKGMQSTMDALQGTNDTLAGSLDTLSVLDEVSGNITSLWVEALKEVFKKRLTNATLEKEVSRMADEIKNQSSIVRGDLQGIRDKVDKINLDVILNTTKHAEFYRWVGTITLLCWQLLVLLVYILANLKKSRYWLIWGIVLGLVSLLLAWTGTGAYLGGTVALSDFCVDPDSFVIGQLEKKLSPVVIRSYVRCENKTDPQKFATAIDDALTYIDKANKTLDEALLKTKKYNISQFLAGPVKELRGGLTSAKVNVVSLSDTVYCGQIHTHYVTALRGMCNRALVGMSLILLMLPALGLCLILLQCCAPRIWFLLAVRKEYKIVDIKDPFLPRPPPYHTYGTIGGERTPLQEQPVMEDRDVLSRPHRVDSDDSPPPAVSTSTLELSDHTHGDCMKYYPGSFVEQYNNLGTFPRPGHRQNH